MLQQGFFNWSDRLPKFSDAVLNPRLSLYCSNNYSNRIFGNTSPSNESHYFLTILGYKHSYISSWKLITLFVYDFFSNISTTSISKSFANAHFWKATLFCVSSPKKIEAANFLKCGKILYNLLKTINIFNKEKLVIIWFRVLWHT